MKNDEIAHSSKIVIFIEHDTAILIWEIEGRLFVKCKNFDFTVNWFAIQYKIILTLENFPGLLLVV